jgi:hypothetical protein
MLRDCYYSPASEAHGVAETSSAGSELRSDDFSMPMASTDWSPDDGVSVSVASSGQVATDTYNDSETADNGGILLDKQPALVHELVKLDACRFGAI